MTESSNTREGERHPTRPAIVMHDGTWRESYSATRIHASLAVSASLPALLWFGTVIVLGVFTEASQVEFAAAWMLVLLPVTTLVVMWLTHGWLAPIESLRQGQERLKALTDEIHRTIYRFPRRLLVLLASLTATYIAVALLGAQTSGSPLDTVAILLALVCGVLVFLLVYLLAVMLTLPSFDAPLTEVGLSESEPTIRLRDLILGTTVAVPVVIAALLLLFGWVQAPRLVDAALTQGAVPHDVLSDMMLRGAILVALLLSLGIVIGHRLVRVLIRPLKSVTDVAEAIARGELRQRPVLSGSRDEMGRMANAVNKALSSLRELVTFTNAVSAGNLRLRLPGEGEMARAFNRLVATQQDLVRQLTETSVHINSSAAEIFATSRESESNASEQASSVEETKRTMKNLLESSSRIAESAHTVYQNAEKTTENIRLIAERLAELVAHNQNIAEILEFVREIADRSDLLALNASLEGTRAGEAGRGFSLVAAEMRRLAESVMDSVTNIKQLVADVRSSSQASVLATEEGMKLGSQTTESARLITFITQQQQSGTEQVSRSMDEISELLNASVAGARQATTSADELRRLSETLQEIIHRFQVDAGESAVC